MAPLSPLLASCQTSSGRRLLAAFVSVLGAIPMLPHLALGLWVGEPVAWALGVGVIAAPLLLLGRRLEFQLWARGVQLVLAAVGCLAWLRAPESASTAGFAVMGPSTAGFAVMGPSTAGFVMMLLSLGVVALLGRTGLEDAPAREQFAPIVGRDTFLVSAVVVAGASLALAMLAFVAPFAPYAWVSLPGAFAAGVSVMALVRMRAASVFVAAIAACMLACCALWAVLVVGPTLPTFEQRAVAPCFGWLWALAALALFTLPAAVWDARRKLAFSPKRVAMTYEPTGYDVPLAEAHPPIETWSEPIRARVAE